MQFRKQPDVIIGQTAGPVYAEIRKPPTNPRRSNRQQQQPSRQRSRHPQHHDNHHHRHRHQGFHNPNRHHHHQRSSTVQPEQPHKEMVELMTIAQPPPHPPPSPRAINNGAGNLVSHSHSSPLLNSVNATRERQQQSQNRSTSERHISENRIQPSLLHVPEIRPLSPLTYGSDSGSNLSNFDDIDHPLPLNRTQGVKEDIGGATCMAATAVSTIAEERAGHGEKEDLSEIPENSLSYGREATLTSPTLTEIYERARRSSRGTSAGSGQDSTLGGAAAMGGTQPNPLIPEESNSLTVATSEDPLWYQNKESSHIETEPMPYETAIRSPPPLSPIPPSPTMAEEGEGERRMPTPWFPMISLATSPHLSDGSATSSSKHSSNNSRGSSSSHRRRSPASASPAGLSSPVLQGQLRKHSLPIENQAKKRSGSGSSTKNPLYSTSDAVSAKKRSLKKHNHSFNSPGDCEPLPPLPPGMPIHSSPLPPLPRPLESPTGLGGTTSPMRGKRRVARTGSDTTRHAHFAPHVSSSPHQTAPPDRQASNSPRMAATLPSSRTPPLAHIGTPPPSRPQPYQISAGAKGPTVSLP